MKANFRREFLREAVGHIIAGDWEAAKSVSNRRCPFTSNDLHPRSDHALQNDRFLTTEDIDYHDGERYALLEG